MTANSPVTQYVLIDCNLLRPLITSTYAKINPKINSAKKPLLRIMAAQLGTGARRRPGRRRAPVPGVEARARHLERPAQQPDRDGGLLHGDEREPHAFSLAKKAVAFFRMSRSIRSVRFSRRRRPSSSRSSVVSVPALPRPASTSACCTQRRTAVSARSSSRATAPTDLPLSRISRTVWALNSVVNVRRLRLAMTHSYRTFVRSGVSTKPGQVQRAHLALMLPSLVTGRGRRSEAPSSELARAKHSSAPASSTCL